MMMMTGTREHESLRLLLCFHGYHTGDRDAYQGHRRIPSLLQGGHGPRRRVRGAIPVCDTHADELLDDHTDPDEPDMLAVVEKLEAFEKSIVEELR